MQLKQLAMMAAVGLLLSASAVGAFGVVVAVDTHNVNVETGKILDRIASEQERITLTVPKTTPNVTGYDPKSLTITVAPLPSIVVVLTSVGTGQDEVFSYPCSTTPGGPDTCTSADTLAEVATMIQGLNTANLTANSLWRRVQTRLCADFPARFPGGCAVP